MSAREKLADDLTGHGLVDGSNQCACGYALPHGPRLRGHAEHLADVAMRALALRKIGPIDHWCNPGCAENECRIGAITFWRTEDEVTLKPEPDPEVLQSWLDRLRLPRGASTLPSAGDVRG